MEDAISRAIKRMRGLHDYAGRPAWDAIVSEELGADLANVARLEADNAQMREALEKCASLFESGQPGAMGLPFGATFNNAGYAEVCRNAIAGRRHVQGVLNSPALNAAFAKADT